MTGPIKSIRFDLLTAADWKDYADDLRTGAIQGVYELEGRVYVQEKKASLDLPGAKPLGQRDIRQIIQQKKEGKSISSITQVLTQTTQTEKPEKVNSGPASKKSKSTAGTEQEFSELVQQTRTAFPDCQIPEKITRVELAKKIVEWSGDLLSQVEPVSQEQIERVCRLLFESNMSALLEKNPSSPHPVWVFQKLYEVLPTLDKPIKELEGTHVNSVYVLKNQKGENLWIFKPISQEVFERKGIKEGQGGKREHVAHLLNYDQFFPIPFTAYVKLRVNLGEKVTEEIGSIQQFVPGFGFHTKTLIKHARKVMSLQAGPATGLSDSEGEKLDYKEVAGQAQTPSPTSITSDSSGSESDSEGIIEKFIDEQLNAQQVLNLVVFDLLFSNSDRETNNFLVGNDFKIYGIDNGLILTESNKDELNIALAYYEQMNISINQMEFFINEDKRFEQYVSLLEKHQMPQNAIKWMKLCVRLLKKTLEIQQKNPQKQLLLSVVTQLLIANKTALMASSDPEKIYMTYLETTLLSEKSSPPD